MKNYYTYTIKKIITIQHLVTIEYLDIDSGFSFPEESHDFYEFIYVEKGRISCKTENDTIVISKNELYLIPAGLSHYYFADHKNYEPTTIFIVCFRSKSTIISTIKGIISVDPEIKELIAKILSEAKSTFIFPFDEKLTLNQHPYLGSQQLIQNHIEEILIRLLQSEIYKNQSIKIVNNTSDLKNSVIKEIIHILNDNIYGKITLSEISRRILYSKTYLNEMFKDVKGVTIMQYYQNLKIKEAKILLDKNESATDIAEKLCFDSPQYFSKAFKKKVGKSPIEYKNR